MESNGGGDGERDRAEEVKKSQLSHNWNVCTISNSFSSKLCIVLWKPCKQIRKHITGMERTLNNYVQHKTMATQ